MNPNQETYQDFEKDYDKTEEMMYMYGWLFTYNPFMDQWAAFPRGQQDAYWVDHAAPMVLRSKHLNTLIDLLHKSKGDFGIIEDLTRGEVK